MDSTLTEIAAIRASQQGDLQAFNALILQYQDFLFRVALRILWDEDLALDAVQETCLLLFKKISSFREGSFRSWLARVVANVCYDELRRQGRHPTLSLEAREQHGREVASPYWLADVSTSPEPRFDRHELERTIQSCLATISPEHQIILILIDIEEFSYEETARALRLPMGTLKSRLARARLQMRKALQRVDGFQQEASYLLS